MKKIALVVLAAFAFLSSTASAQSPAVDPAAAQAVKDLLASMKYRELMNSAMQQMLKNLPQLMLQTATAGINNNTKLDPAAKKAALDKVAKDIPGAISAVQSMLSDPTLIDEMVAEMVPLYARHFTVAELQQLSAFYQSPLGAKMLTTMPQIMNESMQISQKILMPRVKKHIDKVSAGQ
jgi:hypothetical protein